MIDLDINLVDKIEIHGHRDACSKVLQKRTDRDAESKECKEKER